jgi:hypothetical protein
MCQLELAHSLACRVVPFPRSLPIFRSLSHSLVQLAGWIVQVPIGIGSFTCGIVHVLTGVNSFSCLDRNVSPLRYACLPRGDPYVFLRGLRSGLKKKVRDPFFPEGQELLSLFAG